MIHANGTAKALAENPGYHIEIVPDDGSRDLREEMVSHTFELGQWPMFDIKVKMLDADRGIVHMDIDCLILDGWSIRSFLSQLFSAYVGKEILTTDYSFRQYLADEQKWLKERQYYSLARKYWEEQINKLPPAPHLPMKTPLTQIRKPEFSRMTDTLED
ncbi:condensation domain-containing protein [Pseudoramibacter sp. HA2172]|uniref:condensation domain-containing protein n=1 Tax=Pseudoramibacter faecis TaxID=3108534 RepID=UPI002E7A945D|nr:condensation domain-containing protein [Pseudoramibacter sp. HA2172]